MRIAAIDIGTNSMRMLVMDTANGEVVRRQRVTGLGRGVDRTGSLDDEAVERTLAVLAEYGAEIRRLGVDRVRAVATSASRDASDAEAFFDRVEAVVGVRPDLVSGVDEASLAYRGATADAPERGPYSVIDIGGGSTEFVWSVAGTITAVSIDTGSVRLTERLLPDRPATFDQLLSAQHHVEGLFDRVEIPEHVGTVIGVAGTWTSLAAMSLQLPNFDRDSVHHTTLGRREVDRLVVNLAARTIEETAVIPALDPARAPVILAGAVIAREAMRRLAVPQVVVSEHDLLDGVAAGLLEA